MQDGVEGFRCVAGVEIAAGVLPIAVEKQWLAAAEQVDELWYDLCIVLVCQWSRSVATLTFGVLGDSSAGGNDWHHAQTLIPDAGPSHC